MRKLVALIFVGALALPMAACDKNDDVDIPKKVQINKDKNGGSIKY
jgi:hypothetical protein